jgi:hypothetical protein
MHDSVCPHIRTADEGTSYCDLAAHGVGLPSAADIRDEFRHAYGGQLGEGIAEAVLGCIASIKARQ